MMSKADHSAWLRRWDARMKAERASQAAAGDLGQQRLMEVLGETPLAPHRAAAPTPAAPPLPVAAPSPPAPPAAPTALDIDFEKARAAANARFEAERQERLVDETIATAILAVFPSR